MKRYIGQRPLDAQLGHNKIVVVEGDTSRPLEHIVRHSPTGMEWGYSGSGPADLALSILSDHLATEPPPWMYQSFKFDHVAGWDQTGFEISSAEIDRWLAEVG